MKKEIQISRLLDVYGNILKKNHFDVLDYYYNQDLSLSEVSELLGVTRQGVWDLIKRSEEYLFELESKLKFLSKYASLSDKLSIIRGSVEKIIRSDSSDIDSIKTEALKIKNISESLLGV